MNVRTEGFKNNWMKIRQFRAFAWDHLESCREFCHHIFRLFGTFSPLSHVSNAASQLVLLARGVICLYFTWPWKEKQGRIHGRISRVRLGRSSDAKTAQKTPKKQMRYRLTDQPTNQRTDTVGYRVACTRLNIETRNSYFQQHTVQRILYFLPRQWEEGFWICFWIFLPIWRRLARGN